MITFLSLFVKFQVLKQKSGKCCDVNEIEQNTCSKYTD